MANDEFQRLALKEAKEENIAVVYALLALTTTMEELVELERERLTIAGKEAELPCNAMGGGSAGLDTADDFAKHCSYPDKHDGPHSYEEDDDDQQ